MLYDVDFCGRSAFVCYITRRKVLLQNFFTCLPAYLLKTHTHTEFLVFFFFLFRLENVMIVLWWRFCLLIYLFFFIYFSRNKHSKKNSKQEKLFVSGFDKKLCIIYRKFCVLLQLILLLANTKSSLQKLRVIKWMEIFFFFYRPLDK